MIDKDKIGHVYTITTENGSKLNILIEDKPENFAFYKKMGLDVFNKNTVIKPRVVKRPIAFLEDMKAAELKAYAKVHGIKGNTKKDILNAIRKGDK